VRPSAAAAGRRAGPVLAPLRAASPAAAHNKGPTTENRNPQPPGLCKLIKLLSCVQAGLLRSRSSSRSITTRQGRWRVPGSRCAWALTGGARP